MPVCLLFSSPGAAHIHPTVQHSRDQEDVTSTGSGYSRGHEDWKVVTVAPEMLPGRQPGSPRLINDTSVLCK